MVVQIKVFHDGEFAFQSLIITNSRFVLALCIAKQSNYAPVFTSAAPTKSTLKSNLSKQPALMIEPGFCHARAREANLPVEFQAHIGNKCANGQNPCSREIIEGY